MTKCNEVSKKELDSCFITWRAFQMSLVLSLQASSELKTERNRKSGEQTNRGPISRYDVKPQEEIKYETTNECVLCLTLRFEVAP
jgi:hypothetical protein